MMLYLLVNAFANACQVSHKIEVTQTSLLDRLRVGRAPLKGHE